MDVTSQDAKTRILAAAKKLFAENGFDATSVRQICEEADANVALISYHFGGKENVFYALFEHYFPVGALKAFEDQLQEPVQSIQLIVREVIRYLQQDPEMGMLFKREVLMPSPRSEVIKQHVHPVWLKLREALHKGREAGIFHYRSLDHALLFSISVIVFPRGHTFFTPLLSPLFAEGAKAFENIVEDSLQFLFGGLGYVPVEQEKA